MSGGMGAIPFKHCSSMKPSNIIASPLTLYSASTSK